MKTLQIRLKEETLVKLNRIAKYHPIKKRGQIIREIIEQHLEDYKIVLSKIDDHENRIRKLERMHHV